MGYSRAGFEVVGVDINPQPHYPFEFHQGDVLELEPEVFDLFDAIHASPPCQAYSIMRNLTWLKDREYWDSIPPTRELLAQARVPWVIENVQGAPLDGIRLCGQMFDLNWPDGRPIFRHRLFEASWLLLAPPHAKHDRTATPGPLLGSRQTRMSGIGGNRLVVNGRTRVGNGAPVGIDWMNSAELSQAIPPAYTEWIGRQLLAVLERVA